MYSQSTKSYPSLFVKHGTLGSVFVLVYVDDTVITRINVKLVEESIAQLKFSFLLHHLVDLSYFSGYFSFSQR